MPELRKLNRAFRTLSCEMTLERRISDISSINELGRTRLHEKTKVLYLPACPIACGKVPKIALDWKSAPPLVTPFSRVMMMMMMMILCFLLHRHTPVTSPGRLLSTQK